MNIKEKIQELEQRLKDYTQTISIRSLEYTPFIVEVGALTVGTDDKGVVIVENKRYPMQFSEKAVKEILSMKFRNCNDELVPLKVFSKHEWYSEKIESIKMTLEQLRKLAA
jgi:HJR/Mrr/RecB family endonuclease